MKDKPSVLALVVLYKCPPLESSTILSLLKAKEENIRDLRLAIFDNSPDIIEEIDAIFIKENRDWISYHHFKENFPLSKIYNLGIKSSRNEDFMLILDQDSTFDSDFFNSFYHAQKNNPDIDLFIPQVKYNHTLVSPGKWVGFKGKYLPAVHEGRKNSKGLTAIGSGMIIHFRYLKGDFKGFDERFKLYGIDTFFMQQYGMSNRDLFVLPYQMVHDLADYKVESIETKIFRFEEFARGSFLLTERYLLNRILCIAFIGYRALRLAIQFRNLAFLKTILVFLK